MKWTLPAALSAGLFLLMAGCNNTEMKDITTTALPPIPDRAYAKGVSAPFCGVAAGHLVVGGGANFPDAPLLEGGAKKVYRDIWVLDLENGGEWQHAAMLPDSTAYGATFFLDGGLILAGGNVRGNTTDKVLSLRVTGKSETVLTELPSLPFPVEQAGWTMHKGSPVLVGGQSGPDGLTAVLVCQPDSTWEKVSDLPEPLVQCVAFCSGDLLYVWGGFNPSTLLSPVKGYVYDFREKTWGDAPGVPDGGTFVGSTGVPLPDGKFMVVGGVDKAVFERALRNTPEDRIPYLSKEPWEYHFRSEVFVFDPLSASWSSLGMSPDCALAGPGVAVNGKEAIVTGGEIKPGVRSPKTFKFTY